MNEFQKSSLSVIKDISIQLILISVGAIAIGGSILGTRTTPTTDKWAFYTSLICLMGSVLAGLVVLGNAIAQLAAKQFDPWHALLRYPYFIQLILMFCGGILFVIYLARNVP